MCDNDNSDGDVLEHLVPEQIAHKSSGVFHRHLVLQPAQIYLAVFEWWYRFTSFTPDAQPRIRGTCPLERAGYAVSQLPMAQICRGQVLEWPLEALRELAPRE